MMKKIMCTLFALCLLSAVYGSPKDIDPVSVPASATQIALAGNAYQTAGPETGRRGGSAFSGAITPGMTASVYFKVNAAGTMDVFLKAKAEKACTVNVTLGAARHTVSIAPGADFVVVHAGKMDIGQAGYQRVDLSGADLDPQAGLVVSDLLVSGSATREPMNYVHDFEALWGRRGPSVHLNYTMPQHPVEWFYNEVTVPEGNDVIASYFMANGFGEGYFGIQVNSATERRVLFSVWSPFTTDNPKEIPDDQRVVMLKKGETVRTNDFGGEGSGGQSYMVFPWEAGLTYKFLTRIVPDGKGNTTYTAYFYDPKSDAWMLMASFRRPKTDTHYKRAHSFLENFSPAQGYLTRRVWFDNQWTCGVDGQWTELTEATFTCDATGRAAVRVDYQGGCEGDHFYLKNCGFFNETTPYKSVFTRPARGIAPKIDLEALKKMAE